ncbi:unnamed protein product [Sphagnum troendelagicum]|uniref:Uncharacterized protein n=1 Tax=Sphagnum troendelagicum TaxID=128251 RepID=A0ABP0TA79_9BRYO
MAATAAESELGAAGEMAATEAAAAARVSNHHSSLSLREESLGDQGAQYLRPARTVAPERFGQLGIRWPTEQRKSYCAEVRVQVPGWIGDNRIWVGSFPTLEKVKRAIDAVLHFSGETPHHFVYSQGFFERAPPEFEEAPETEEFKSFLKRMVQKYANDIREVPDRKPISESPNSPHNSSLCASPCIRAPPRKRDLHEGITSDYENSALMFSVTSSPTASASSSTEVVLSMQNFDEDFSIADSNEDHNDPGARESSVANPEDLASLCLLPAFETFCEDVDDVQGNQTATFTMAWDSLAMPSAHNPPPGSITPTSESHFM